MIMMKEKCQSTFPAECIIIIQYCLFSFILDVDRGTLQPVDISQVSQNGLSHMLEVDVEPARLKEVRDEILLSCMPKDSRLRTEKSAFTTAVLK